MAVITIAIERGTRHLRIEWEGVRNGYQQEVNGPVDLRRQERLK